MIYDSVENLATYCDIEDPIYKAVRFVVEFDPSQDDGTYPIDGEDIFAIVQSVNTKDAKENPFESHEKYLDVQMVLAGEERHDIALMDTTQMDTTSEYDQEKDVTFYNAPEGFATVIMKPGAFVVYGPSDIHRPGCSIGETSKIARKVCVKIKL